jgi:hypothetical protein
VRVSHCAQSGELPPPEDDGPPRSHRAAAAAGRLGSALLSSARSLLRPNSVGRGLTNLVDERGRCVHSRASVLNTRMTRRDATEASIRQK